MSEIPEVTITTKIETTSTTINSDSQNSTTTSTEIKKLDCPLEGEKKFVIDIINNSEKKTNLGLFFYINSLYDPLDTNPIKTQCVEENERTNFKFNFDMNNKPVIGRFGDGTQDWYDICFQPIKDVFKSDEKIYFEFTDDEILINSKLIYDRVIDRNTGYVTFVSEDESKPNVYCDNIDLETSLPATTTTTTLPENVLIEFDNCLDTVRDNENFVLNFTVFAGNNEITDIKYSQKYLSVNENGSFKNLDLNIPSRNSFESYTLSYNYDKTQQNNWTREFKLFVETKSGSITEGTCKTTVIVTNPPTTTTTTTATATTTTTTTTNQGPIWSNDPISFSRINTTYLDILWGQANDPDGVEKYEIYVNGQFEKTIYGEETKRTTIYGLEPGTNYNFEIKACDTLGNCSINNPTASKTTSGSSSSGSSSNTSYPATPSSSTWSRFNGSGDSVLDISSVGSNVLIAYIEYNGSGNFSVITRDSNLGYQGLMVNEIGNYSGTIPINFNSETNAYLDISATGSWEVVVKPIASADNFDSNSISGIGDSVIEAYELQSVDTLTINYTGSGNFIVTQYRCNGSYNSLLVNEIGSYSGTVVTDSGTCFIEINAEGNWSISK